MIRIVLVISTMIVSGLLWVGLQYQDKDYDAIYLQAMLAYEKRDYDNALIYFNQLYQLRPKDLSYYRDYANTVLMVDPKNGELSHLINALQSQPERDLSLWLLFARYEQTLNNNKAACQDYAKALGLVTPNTPLFEAIKEQYQRLYCGKPKPSP